MKGRYYFSPPNTPHAPKHNLGSRNWEDRNHEIQITLGENPDAKTVYDFGEPPSLLPFARLVGSPRCIAQGSASGFPFDETVAGFLPDCYTAIEQADVWPIVSEFATCNVQRNCAYIIHFIYEEDEASIRGGISAWLGDSVVVNVHFSTGLRPSVVTVIGPDWSAAFLNGTTSFQQLALQAFGSLEGPVNQGIFGTVPLWYNSSSYVLALLSADGMRIGDKVFFSGHSYGSAVAMCCAARLRAFQPLPLIRYLTFGSPKLGDARLQALVNRCSGFDLINSGDFVAFLPPDLTLSSLVWDLFPIALLRNFNLWLPSPTRYLVLENGRLIPDGTFVIGTHLLDSLISAAVSGNPIAALRPHTMDEYLDRILNRCPGDFPPMSECDVIAEYSKWHRMTIISPDYPFIDGRSDQHEGLNFPWVFGGGPPNQFFMANVLCGDPQFSDELGMSVFIFDISVDPPTSENTGNVTCQNLSIFPVQSDGVYKTFFQDGSPTGRSIRVIMSGSPGLAITTEGAFQITTEDERPIITDS